MNKFLFKSALDSDLSKNIINKLDMILAEQRHQRSDLSILLNKLTKIYNALALQKQVDEYFEEAESATAGPIPEDTRNKE